MSSTAQTFYLTAFESDIKNIIKNLTEKKFEELKNCFSDEVLDATSWLYEGKTDKELGITYIQEYLNPDTSQEFSERVVEIVEDTAYVSGSESFSESYESIEDGQANTVSSLGESRAAEESEIQETQEPVESIDVHHRQTEPVHKIQKSSFITALHKHPFEILTGVSALSAAATLAFNKVMIVRSKEKEKQKQKLKKTKQGEQAKCHNCNAR